MITLKYVSIIEIPAPHLLTKKFNVHANEGMYYLGEIKWRSGWRRYAFFPSKDTLYESQCLRDIADFLDKLMRSRKPPCNCFAATGNKHMIDCPKARPRKATP